MGFEKMFQKIASTVVDAFGDIPKVVSHITVTDDGFNNYNEQTQSIKLVKLETKTISTSVRFRDKIKSKDIIGLVPSYGLSRSIKHNDFIELNFVRYKVIDFELDPAAATYTILLRK